LSITKQSKINNTLKISDQSTVEEEAG